MMVLICDGCNKEFTMEVKEDELYGDITKVYFTCPHCCKEYISHYLDENIKQKQQEIQEIVKKQKYNKGTSNIGCSKKLHKQYKRLKKQLKKDMELLRIKVEKI